MKYTIGERVRLTRETLQMTSNEFSHYIGYDIATQSKIENGKTKISDKYLKRVCERFNISKEYLLTERAPVFKSGTIEDNIKAASDLSIPLPKSDSENPWKDALVTELKEEVNYLKKLLEMALGGGGGGKTNFLPATDLLRVAFKKKLAA